MLTGGVHRAYNDASMVPQRSDRMAGWLRAHGLRPSSPRIAVLSYLERQRQHLTPYEIYEGLRAAGEPVSIATLYQNLQALSRHGLIKRIVGPDGAVRYDVNLAPHHHLLCERCGRLVDVELSEPLDVRPVLLFTQDQDDAPPSDATQAGWQINGAHVEFRGTCPECSRRSSSSAGTERRRPTRRPGARRQASPAR